MMHEHDFELIAAIAEGGLGPNEQTAAETSLASCELCSIDLELQREALTALRSAPPVMMTDHERTVLHGTIAAELTPVHQRPASRTSVPWFQRFVPAMATAAALLVVVGVGSVLVGTGNTDTAAEPTTVANESLRAPIEEESAGASDQAQFDDAVAATTTTMMATGTPAASIIQDYGSISAADLADITKRLKSGEDGGLTQTYTSRDLESLSIEPSLFCAEIALAKGSVTTIGRAIVDGDAVEIYRVDDLVEVYSAADCNLLVPPD